jgi:geranylgeranyl diphosphate synthase type II
MSTAARSRIEHALAGALAGASAPGHPPGLAAAVRHAVFPGGARIRPQLCLAVAHACGMDDPELAVGAAVAVELLHCASLVHDDLPCFDAAAIRRGQPSVHCAFGERLAVLAGDALIVLAFEALGKGAAQSSHRLASLMATLVAGVGLPCGIAAGQAWECEPCIDLARYHRAKTGALFIASASAGAQAAGADASGWARLGARLGDAYQAADDIRDVAGTAQWLGKPVGRDEALARPSLARERGLAAATRHFERLVAEAEHAVPDCAGAASLRALVRAEADRLIPRQLARELVRSAA